MTNYTEDYLISKIDSQRGVEVKDEVVEDVMEEKNLRKFVFWVMESQFSFAEACPGLIDKDVLMRARSYELLLIREKGSLQRFLQKENMSRRKIMALDPIDKRRVLLKKREVAIEKLEKERDRLLACVYARKFLKENPKWVRNYLSISGLTRQKDIENSFNRLHQLYPET